MAQTQTSALTAIGGRTRRLPATPLPNLELQHLWFHVADKRSWLTLALVPVDDDLSTLSLARALAQMAAHQAGSRVLLVNAAVEDAVAGARGAERPVAEVDETELGFDLVDLSTLPAAEAHRAVAVSTQLIDDLAQQGRTYTTSIFVTDALLLHTTAIPLARSADAVILCVRVGHTPLPDVKRLARIIGRERVIGSVALRPKALAGPTLVALQRPEAKVVAATPDAPAWSEGAAPAATTTAEPAPAEGSALEAAASESPDEPGADSGVAVAVSGNEGRRGKRRR